MTTDHPPPSGTGLEQTVYHSRTGKDTKIKIPSVEFATLMKRKTWNTSYYTVQFIKILEKKTASYNNLI